MLADVVCWLLFFPFDASCLLPMRWWLMCDGDCTHHSQGRFARLICWWCCFVSVDPLVVRLLCWFDTVEEAMYCCLCRAAVLLPRFLRCGLTVVQQISDRSNWTNNWNNDKVQEEKTICIVKCIGVNLEQKKEPSASASSSVVLYEGGSWTLKKRYRLSENGFPGLLKFCTNPTRFLRLKGFPGPRRGPEKPT